MQLRFALICVVTIVLGCVPPRLSDERSVTLEIGEIRTLAIDPLDVEQTIEVVASSADGPFDVHIYHQEHEAQIERSLTLGKPAKHVIASHENTQETRLEATIQPEKTAIIRFYPRARQQTTVNVSLSN
ncbi:MAG: hypothetical protein CMJ81_08360 [Planctomycetaceae bacterium]|nr:hypothetical protein [Planctomycetaceae bacterium]